MLKKCWFDLTSTNKGNRKHKRKKGQGSGCDDAFVEKTWPRSSSMFEFPCYIDPFPFYYLFLATELAHYLFSYQILSSKYILMSIIFYSSSFVTLSLAFKCLLMDPAKSFKLDFVESLICNHQKRFSNGLTMDCDHVMTWKIEISCAITGFVLSPAL